MEFFRLLFLRKSLKRNFISVATQTFLFLIRLSHYRPFSDTSCLAFPTQEPIVCVSMV